MDTEQPRFNLVDEPWLPCVRAADGAALELGLRDALVQAHELRELADPSPLVTVALHRLLLAVAHRVFGPANAGEWARLWQAGRFDAAALDAYFAGERGRPRFNLFDEQWPFYQTPEVEFDYAKPIATIVYGLTLGNYVTLFDHTVESRPVAMRPADAARNLVAYQSFALGGLVSLRKGEPAGEFKSADAAPLAKGAVTLVTGQTLFETLLLNMVSYDGAAGKPFDFTPERDQPAWERDEPTTADDRLPDGYLDLLTWQSRRMRLRPSVEPDGTVVVRETVSMKGYQFPSDFPPAEHEQMLAYRKILKPASGQEPWAVLPFRRDRALWRDSQALYAATGEESARPRTLSWLGNLAENGYLDHTAVFDLDVLGMSIDRATVFFWRHERLPLPLKLLDDPQLVARVGRALELAENVGDLLRPGFNEFKSREGKKFSRPRPLDIFAQRLLAPSDERQPDRAAVTQLVESLQAGHAYWARLEIEFRRYVEALARADDDGVAALNGWRTALRASVSQAFNDAIGSFDISARALKASALAGAEFGWQLVAMLGRDGQSGKEELDAAAT